MFNMKGNQHDLAKKYQERRPHLLTFLRGSKKQKEELKADQPILYDYFSDIWSLRNRHMVPGLPSLYVFQLLLCYEKDCIHPLCKEGTPKEEETWFPGGPALTYLPIPIPDVKSRQGQSCEKCGEECTGHYLKAVDHIEHVRQNGYSDCQFEPPRSVIEKETKDKAKKNTAFSNDELQALAEKCCLPVTDVHMWVEHVEGILSRRKAKTLERARQKAAQGKDDNSGKQTECEDEGEEEIPVWCFCQQEEYGFMIMCEQQGPTCHIWYHGPCVKISKAKAKKIQKFICFRCK